MKDRRITGRPLNTIRTQANSMFAATRQPASGVYLNRGHALTHEEFSQESDRISEAQLA